MLKRIISLSSVEKVENKKIIPVRYADLKKGKNIEANIILKSGDVMVIP
jgi:hypothetical protein